MREQHMPYIVPTETDGIVLRRLFSPSDYESYSNLVMENRAYLMPHCEGVVRSVPRIPEENKLDIDGRYGIFNKRLLLGGIKVSELEGGDADLGYWIAEKFMRNGYATVAVRALSRRAGGSGEYTNTTF